MIKKPDILMHIYNPIFTRLHVPVCFINSARFYLRAVECYLTFSFACRSSKYNHLTMKCKNDQEMQCTMLDYYMPQELEIIK